MSTKMGGEQDHSSGSDFGLQVEFSSLGPNPWKQLQGISSEFAITPVSPDIGCSLVAGSE